MMLLLYLYIGIGLGLVTAQTQTVRGVVVSEEDGQSIVGASVLVVGTSLGTVTDANGRFVLSGIPSSAKTLRVSYVGMITQEVAVGNAALNIRLKPDAQALDEIVVTAMGIKRSEKALGYAAAFVNNEAITGNRTADIISGLSGKIAGVQISTGSDPGSSNSVIIRGASSLSGSNQPLYVIDGVPMNNFAIFSGDGFNSDNSLDYAYDYGNGANAVNPDDVENMTVLKGAAATALYGSRAANGVILITTKSGKSQQKGLGVEYNGGLQAESILRLPEMQNEFGIGWSGNHTFIENGSWGPRFDGSMQLWGTVYNNSQKLKPFLPMENNIKDFFDTGVRYSNSVSFNGATDVSDYYVSFSQISDDGMLPTSADTYDKYTFSMRGGHKIGNLSLSTAINYTSQQNKFSTTGQGFSMINSLYQMPRDVSIIGLQDLNDPFNAPGYYYTPYGVTNPYYILNTYLNTYNSEKLFGKFEAEYSFLTYFKGLYRIGLDSTNGQQNLGTPNMKSLFAGTPNTGGNLEKEEGSVTVLKSSRREINQDFLLTFHKPVSDITIDALAGININERKYSDLFSKVTGLDIPEWYNLSNSPNTPSTSEYNSLRRLIGVFGQVELSWKDMVYLTGTARNDWSSTLPKGSRDFFYPGVTGSFVFTEIFPSALKKWFSFGKVRLAYGQTGNDADVYMIDPVFAQAIATASGWGTVGFPLKGTNAFSQGNILGNANLSPEITTEYEVGLNVAFFNNRISLDAAYYNRNSDKQIFSLNMDPASGFTAQNINLGKVENKGVELLVNLRPIQMKDFTWDVSWNFTKNNSKVISLPEELGGIALIYGLTGGTSMYAIVGEPVGTFKAQVAERDDKGRIVVNDQTGLPVGKSDFEICGNMNYDYEMGISTKWKYKGISLGVDFDIRQGGVMYTRTKDINYFTGNVIQTAYNDRNTFIVPNSVNKLSNGTYVENTTPIVSESVYEYWGHGGSDMGSAFLIDKSYVKLRSVILGWDLPKSWLKKTFLQTVKLSAYGNNLAVWTPASNTFIDPELTSFGNDLEGKYGEWTANPSSRKFGFNLMVKF
ncbi:TonB-dependent receptor SusC [termite gut metagenome]|uniref:TonB-dependent receptor SusC n=1 Tax=termite gut metagenome TaxID=433724 RepID=A0A5J4S7G4_9ZZZZ